MIGLIVVAHGSLARSLLEATEHVVGPLTNAHAVAIEPSDDLHARQAEINRLVIEANSGEGVVLVTDMFGGTPSNLAFGAISGPEIEVICGANLPLLVKLAKTRDRPLEQAVQAALDAGHKYIDAASRILDPARER
ncbi:MAG TPA: PTS sugar transporter subunit IIA [Thermohalobaculum sp.]|nr:PTS sugar transporter subunit IIA [Thermohalobaculum sp.]